MRLYKEEEEEEMRGGGVGAGDEFEGACKRRHGGGSDLNFYLLLAHSSPLSLSSLPCLRCVLPSLSTQPDEKRRRDAREREGEKGRNGVRVRERESARGSVFSPPFLLQSLFVLPFPRPGPSCVLYLAFAELLPGGVPAWPALSITA